MTEPRGATISAQTYRRVSRPATKAALMVASSLTVLAGTTVAPALPMLQARFADIPHSELLVRLVLTLSSLVIAVTGPLAGLLVDRHGRKPWLIAGLVAFGISGAAGGLLDSLYAILLTRAGLGLSIALIMTAVTALIADYYEAEERARFMGFQASLMGFGGVLFLLLGGVLAEDGWRTPFFVHLVGWALLPPVIAHIVEPHRPAPVDRSPTAPSEPDERLPVRPVLTITAAVFLGMGAFYVIPVQLPFFLSAMADLGPGPSGIAISACTLVGAVVSLFYARLKARFSFSRLLAATFALLGAGIAVAGMAHTYAVVVAGMALAGLGIGLLMPNLTLWLTVTVPASRRGRAVGWFSTGLFLGQFVSPLLLQPLIDAFSMRAAFLAVAGLLGLAALASLRGRS